MALMLDGTIDKHEMVAFRALVEGIQRPLIAEFYPVRSKFETAVLRSRYIAIKYVVVISCWHHNAVWDWMVVNRSG